MKKVASISALLSLNLASIGVIVFAYLPAVLFFGYNTNRTAAYMGWYGYLFFILLSAACVITSIVLYTKKKNRFSFWAAGAPIILALIVFNFY